jgi:rubrerythrin
MFENLNAFDVLDIALKVEANGVRFYEAAAKGVDEPQASGLLDQLAQWEQRHVRIFSDLQERLSRENGQRETYEAQCVRHSDAQLLAGLAVFGIQPNPWPELTGKETPHDVLGLALKKERESVTFYRGLKDFVPADSDRKVIDRVLQEELVHVKVLEDALRR